MPLDAADSVMNITAGLAINGTYAHVYVHNLSGLALTGNLHLESPNGTTVMTVAIDASGVVFMYDADLAVNGTWKVKSDLGAIVTQFDVAVWNGTEVDMRNDLVTLFSDSANFLDDDGDAFPGAELRTTAAADEGDLEANSNTDSVDARFVRQDIALPTECVNPGPPATCDPALRAQYVKATPVSTGLVFGDVVIRTIEVAPADPLAQWAGAACASIRFEPPRLQNEADDVQCLTAVQVDHDFRVDLEVRASFVTGGIPILKTDRDGGFFSVSWDI